MRVYAMGNYHVTEIDEGEAARRFLAWLADDASTTLTELIQSWLWQPPDTGGLGVLAESAWDLALLRAEVAALWQPHAGAPAQDGRAGR
ncbi:MAG: hypothetical protein ACRDPY_06280 [Streptosporangiaceae bacterium]